MEQDFYSGWGKTILSTYKSHTIKVIAWPVSRSSSPEFPSRSFSLGSYIQVLMHFELIFASGIREGSNFILLHAVT